MSHRDLVLLSALMRDAYWKITPGAVRNWTHQQAGPCPHVYHKLKRLEPMERLANSSLLARAPSPLARSYQVILLYPVTGAGVAVTTLVPAASPS